MAQPSVENDGWLLGRKVIAQESHTRTRKVVRVALSIDRQSADFGQREPQCVEMTKHMPSEQSRVGFESTLDYTFRNLKEHGRRIRTWKYPVFSDCP